MEGGKKIDTVGEMKGCPGCSSKSSLLSKQAEGKGSAWKAFPIRETDAPFGQLFFLLSALIIRSAYSQERLKQNTGLCVLPDLA